MSALDERLASALLALPEIETLYPSAATIAGVLGRASVEVAEGAGEVRVVVRLAATRGTTATAAAAAARAVVLGVLAVDRADLGHDVHVRVVGAHAGSGFDRTDDRTVDPGADPLDGGSATVASAGRRRRGDV